jgi:hypothetical protein
MGCEALPIEYYESLAEKGSDPYNIPSSIAPSSFGGLPSLYIGMFDVGNHALNEPSARADDTAKHRDMATAFTKEQLATQVEKWFSKCKCTDTVES